MQFHDTDLPGLKLVTLDVRRDARGAFSRLFCQREMAAAGVPHAIAQVNHSQTAQKGSVRGLHFQRPPVTETKLIRCVRGAVWDVAVDLRAGSPTFLQWRAFELSADQPRMVVIPDGFAHGFQTLTDDAELIYFHSEFYAPEHEDGFHAQDATLAIAWPLPMAQQSDRDRQLPSVPTDFKGLTLL
ncbi:dTDP-4-dehydrorhamnose 3,5-epimerase family protein [Aquabacterium sp.]|uniref:dTDP-4-dehydrorhamnose 3,5-epimerase family protein n=1 Tax=Aquabacterium sp. TaxID=1872578 RepID=UPI002488E099|nr:dTDP-4-dehydrorhamnose 3,5-epimerase family protein [Aquabacterium sp.]MDI1347842.1 dTDP-4-dehydrorhamnose 3,5-epimerase family protein [Aquabacterium sp.]